jgi:hypothetical protein
VIKRGEFVSDEEMAEFFKRHGVRDALTPRGSA